jgi:hypothetical protein
VQGNLHAPFGKRTTEKDLHHRHLAGVPLHSGGGPQKRTGRNAGTALWSDLTTSFITRISSRLRGNGCGVTGALGRRSGPGQPGLYRRGW